VRGIVYERAEGVEAEEPFGTGLDVRHGPAERLRDELRGTVPARDPGAQQGRGARRFRARHRRGRSVGVPPAGRRRSDPGDRYRILRLPHPRRGLRGTGVRGQGRAARLLRRTDPTTVRSYARLHEWLEPGVLLTEPPASWEADWKAADPDAF
jgi:hypothetical protein